MAQDDCPICTQGLSAPSNPLLCADCQIWNGLGHVTDCLRDEYPGIDPELFSHESGVRGLYKRVYNAGLDTLTFRPLDSASARGACLVCTEIRRAIYDSVDSVDEIRDWEVAVWRPFSFQYKSPEVEDQDPEEGSVARVVTPVCLSSTTKADNEPQYVTRLVELELRYNDPRDYNLRGVTQWDRTKIDVSIIRRWLADCQNDHGPNCNTLVVPLSLPPHFRLIDSHEWRVVAAQEPVEYVALSYIWAAATASAASPTDQPFQLDTKSLRSLEEKGSLRTGKLPELIADAMHLCADIGYRYLWVDRLCIVQDAGDMKMEQINAMDAIYHKAVMTIVALGDGGSGKNKTIGLPGAPTRPRKVSLDHKLWILSIDGTVSGVHSPGIHNALTTAPWNRRGWTYQERVLSRRHLFVDNDYFYLNCVRVKYESDEVYIHNTRRSGLAGMSDAYDNGYERGIRTRTKSPDYFDPAMSRYAAAVREYTARKLSSDSDSLNAFLGVGNMFAAQHRTRLLFGLPEKYLFQALLWHHIGATWRRRDMPADGPQIPSWSWAAWEGALNYKQARWHFGETAYEVCPDSEAHVGHLVRLYYADPSMNDGQGGVRPVEEVRLWFQRRGKEASDTGEELPSRWADIIHYRSKMNGDTALELWRTCVHSPWEAAQHAEIKDVGLLANVPPGSLIFNTTKATLTIEERVSKDSSHESEEQSQNPSMNFSLIDSKGNVVGQVLPLARDEALRTFHSSEMYGVVVLGACITTKVERSGKDPWGLAVLIVRDEEGISRRVALGAVNPRAWTDLQPSWETVILA
jgi:hypothetical protein